MSGFVGILNLDGAPADVPLLERMTQYLGFRGPDAQATWQAGTAGLGHTLLRTTLESARERQPCSLDGAVWIVADARVDGRTELLQALRAGGRAVSASAPDVELILHAYQAWGEACVEHLIGDFAFAVWDAPHGRLLCARDQFGVAQLYYARVDNSLVFSNTLNALRLHPGISDELNEQALGDFLLFGMNEDSATTSFAGIQRVPPAHRLTWCDGRLAVQRCWSPPDSDIQYRPPLDTVAEFGALFERAVGDRLRTERVAAQLSGGMDSASVALTACRLRDRDGLPSEVRAHTLVFRKLRQDPEDEYASLVAEHARLPREAVAVDDEPAGQEVEEPRHLSPEPGLPAGAAAERLGDRIGEFSRVLLTGYGGDPLLYPSQTYLAELVKTLRWGRLIQGLRLAWQMQGDLPPLYARTWLKRRLGARHPRPLPAWLHRSFVERLGLEQRWEQRFNQAGPVDNRLGMAGDAFWPELFARADAGFTHRPLQTRYPFFDVRLLSFAQTVPPVPWFTNKLLLREAMRDIMPERVRQRTKTPLDQFPVQARALPLEQQAWMLELANAPELEPYVDRKQLLLTIQSPSQQNGFEYSQIFQPLALAYWLKRQRRIA